jgi:hypothetical protein
LRVKFTLDHQFKRPETHLDELIEKEI